MPAPRRKPLYHVPVKVKVTVDPEEYAATYVVGRTRDEIFEHVRQLSVHRLSELPSIINVRRNGA